MLVGSGGGSRDGGVTEECGEITGPISVSGVPVLFQAIDSAFVLPSAWRITTVETSGISCAWGMMTWKRRVSRLAASRLVLSGFAAIAYLVKAWIRSAAAVPSMETNSSPIT